MDKYSSPFSFQVYDQHEKIHIDQLNTESDEITFSIQFTSKDLRRLNYQVRALEYFINKRDSLKNRAIQNLFKIKRTLELTNNLANGDIDEDEFNEEIKDNPNRYVIELSSQVSTQDINIITEIISNCNLQDEITIDEASEMFSIDHQSFINVLHQSGRLLQDR